MDKTNNTVDLGKGPVGRLLWQYALPAIVGTMVNALYNVADRIFIGQGVGPDAISGLALTLPVLTMLQAVGMLIGIGAASRISISLGQKNKLHAEKILGNALTLTFITQLVVIAAGMFFMEPMLRAFGGSDNTIPYAQRFLTILIPGNILAALSFGFNNVMRASGYPRKAMYTMLIGAVLNVILDPIFIFGFDMGIEGAAIATLISMAVTTVWVMSHFMKKEAYLRFRKGYCRLNRLVVGSIISIGMSPFLMQVAASIVNVIVNTSLKTHGGDSAIGAFGIINSFMLLLMMFIIGLNQGMQPIVGYNYGAKLYDRVLKTLKYGMGMASVVAVAGTMGGFFFPELIARAFTRDAELIRFTADGLKITLSAFFVVGFQAVATNFFQSIGMASRAIFLSLTRQFIFLIPALLILPRYFGLNGVWAALPVSDLLSAMLTGCFLFLYIRKIIKMT
jgi:putative efflux protein, MATE family